MEALEDGFTRSSYSMREYVHEHTIRALKIMVSGFLAYI
jgi:hypothetical protein